MPDQPTLPTRLTPAPAPTAVERVRAERAAFAKGAGYGLNYYNLTSDQIERAAAATFPMPTVEVPRVVEDASGVRWSVRDTCLSWSYDGRQWSGFGTDDPTRGVGHWLTIERALLVADLLATPTRTVPADSPEAADAAA